MTPIFAIILIMHILAGLIGVGASYGALMVLFKRVIPLTFLRWASLVAFFSYLVSWFSGGYYYVMRYGLEVKPLILAGEYPWAHRFGMEVKEHIFLFLPVLAATFALIVWTHGEKFSDDRMLWRGVVALASILVILGTMVTLLGVLVSGSAS